MTLLGTGSAETTEANAKTKSADKKTLRIKK